MTEFRPGRFQILPTIVKNLIIINVLVFLAQTVFGNALGFSFEDVFALHTWQSDLFKPWQFITHLFMHGSLGHIFGNMLALWMFGSILENVWGPKRFLLFYLVCGLGAALCHLSVLAFQFGRFNDAFMHFQQNPTVVGYAQFLKNTKVGEAVFVKILSFWGTN